MSGVFYKQLVSRRVGKSENKIFTLSLMPLRKMWQRTVK
jgi:iron only hydrogenase large subunit-like protein